MLWYALSVLLAPMYVLVVSLLGDDRDRLILAPCQQVGSNDMSPSAFSCAFAERLADAASWHGGPPTRGCPGGTLRYYRNDVTNRSQMAVFPTRAS